MTRLAKLALPLLLGVAFTGAGLSSALACACCSHPAQRSDVVQKIDANMRAKLEQMNFSREAKLSMGERDDGIPGLDNPSEQFTVAVARLKDRINFALRDAKGRAGTLSLVKPTTIAMFEVDPRDAPDAGTGPSLYKEWRIATPVAGDGVFKASVASNRRLTLVMHGRGNSCTEAEDFKHWTLVVAGPNFPGYTFYGALGAEAKK